MIWKVEFSCGICGNFSGSFIFTWTLARSLNRDLHQNSTLEKIQKVLSQHLDHVTGSDQGSQSCFKSEVQIEKWLTEVIGHSAPHFAHTADVRWGECHRHETLPTIHPVLAGSRPAWTQLHKKISTRMCLILTCISSPQLGLGWGALSLLPESPGYNLSISLLYCKSFR